MKGKVIFVEEQVEASVSVDSYVLGQRLTMQVRHTQGREFSTFIGAVDKSIVNKSIVTIKLPSRINITGIIHKNTTSKWGDECSTLVSINII